MMNGKLLKIFIWLSAFLSMACLLYSEFTPVDNYLIDCGSSKETVISKHRVFLADNSSSNSISTLKTIFSSTRDLVNSSEDSQLYQTARIFNGIAKYSFTIHQPGRHWIRLHFYPFLYESYDMSMATFDVFTQNHVLLSNFSVNTMVVKEFLINLTVESLEITFFPSANSFAFLSALEVVSAPDSLIAGDPTAFNIKKKFHGLPWQALETIHRVNMGGPLISSRNDTLGRTWISDTNFLTVENAAVSVSNISAVKYIPDGATPYTAPKAVYGTASQMSLASNFNITWKFNVVPGFQYFVRFHFCDIVSTELYQLYFDVYIDSWRVAENFNPNLQVSNTLGGALYMDFVTALAVGDTLLVSVGPSFFTKADPNAILNGLEIMKMNNSLGSLSGAASLSNSSSEKRVIIIVASTVGALVVVVVGVLFVLRRKSLSPLSRDSKCSDRTTCVNSTLSSRIPFLAVQEATDNFNESWVIGVGGFGKVYKGVLNDGTKVAIKRASSSSQQGLREFQTEIKMLSQFRHCHLVSLIGYCDENNEMILIYEYMENGTLKSHLHGSGHSSLPWKRRLEICIGTAKGLHYLHTGHAKPIIHRDVKSSNILLDENLMAKVADFGLSKTGPDIDQSHVSTGVKGSFGYFDPEYFRWRRLTVKSDVYSFGVVLFEVLCAKPVINPTHLDETENLAGWAVKWQKKGKLEQIIDPTLVGKIRPNSLKKFAETAEKCLADHGVYRPSMEEVLWNLELALQLQEEASPGDNEENSTYMIHELFHSTNNFSEIETSYSVAESKHEV